MRLVLRGFALSLVMSTAAVAATKDVVPQVVIQCRCLDLYPAWVCEALWWALC